MSKSIGVNLLNKAVMEQLQNYKENIEDIVVKTSNEIGREAVEELGQISPRGARRQYRKGWKLKKGKVERNIYVIKIYNATDAQLTHLLEFGHATRNGKRTMPQSHIRRIEQKYSKLYEQKLKQRIRR